MPDRIHQAISRLEYDFSQFDLNEFIRHVERHARREILLEEKPLRRDVSAFWINACTAHYIIYNLHLHPIHQTHSILHEVAHILLGHSCKKLSDVFPSKLLAQLDIEIPAGRMRQRQPPGHDPAEREAEEFAFQIQTRVLAARRQEMFMGQSSSNERLRHYVDTMGFDL